MGSKSTGRKSIEFMAKTPDEHGQCQRRRNDGIFIVDSRCCAARSFRRGSRGRRKNTLENPRRSPCGPPAKKKKHQTAGEDGKKHRVVIDDRKIEHRGLKRYFWIVSGCLSDAGRIRPHWVPPPLRHEPSTCLVLFPESQKHRLRSKRFQSNQQGRPVDTGISPHNHNQPDYDRQQRLKSSPKLGKPGTKPPRP